MSRVDELRGQFFEIFGPDDEDVWVAFERYMEAIIEAARAEAWNGAIEYAISLFVAGGEYDGQTVRARLETLLKKSGIKL